MSKTRATKSKKKVMGLYIKYYNRRMGSLLGASFGGCVHHGDKFMRTYPEWTAAMHYIMRPLRWRYSYLQGAEWGKGVSKMFLAMLGGGREVGRGLLVGE